MPWQRGSNENTNGLLRQYLQRAPTCRCSRRPNSTRSSTRLNSRPRKMLGFATPDEVFSALVDKAANAVTAQNAEGVRYGT